MGKYSARRTSENGWVIISDIQIRDNGIGVLEA